MNIQEIIESGIIELYLMNALPKDEAAEVEALAVAHSEIRVEIEDIQNALQQYTQVYAIEPKPELKEKILEKIKAEQPLTIQNQATLSPVKIVETSPLSIKPIWITWLAAAASVVSIVLFFQNMNNKKALTNCTAENTKLVENQKVIVQLEYKLDILRRSDTKEIEMKGLGIAPESRVLVYWNSTEKATLLSIQNLPKPADDKQYQLWAIVDKKPVDAGVFVYDATAVQQMKGFEHAEAFAVTLEPKGGSIAPTLDKMYVLGTVL